MSTKCVPPSGTPFACDGSFSKYYHSDDLECLPTHTKRANTDAHNAAQRRMQIQNQSEPYRGSIGQTAF